MTDLTSREAEVLHLAVDGLSNDEIADRLLISRRTVEAHLRTLFRKTGATRRSQLSGLVAVSAVREVGDDRRRLDRYDTAIGRLADRHLALFEERVEITFTVGGRGGADTVVERRWTTPRPYVVYRMLRPVVGAGLDPDGLALACDVHGRDVHADVLAVGEPDDRPLAVVLFQPGLEAETEWELRYRSEGLWDPLREIGADRLGWATATAEQRHRPTITELVVRLVFPPGWTEVGLAERDGAGVVSDVARQQSGQQVVSWRDGDPTTAAYEWRLTGTLER